MNNHDNFSDTKIRAVLTAPIDTTPRVGFREELARDLAVEWDHAGSTRVVPTRGREPERGWWWTLGAAAAAVVLIGGLVVVSGRNGSAPNATIPDTTAVTNPTTVDQATTLPGPAPDPTTTSPEASTTPDTVVPSTQPTTSAVPIEDRPVTMTDWPLSTVTEVPLDQLPYLLLNSDTAFSRIVRFESTGVNEPNEASAIWVATDGPGWLLVATTPDPTSIASIEISEPIDDPTLTATGWTTQRMWTGLPDTDSALDIADANGVVSLHGFGITSDQLLQIARGMVRRPLPQAGWDLTDTPFPMQLFVEANERSFSTRNVVYFNEEQQPAAELIVSALDSSSIQRGWWDEFSTRQAVELRPAFAGGEAVSARMSTPPSGDRVDLVWTQNNYLVTLALVGVTPDQAVAIANSIVEVPAQQWLDSTVESDPADDGCQSLFC